MAVFPQNVPIVPSFFVSAVLFFRSDPIEIGFTVYYIMLI